MGRDRRDQYARKDPVEQHPQPEFAEQSQPHPGETGAMRPEPDHGEQTYRGSGRLKGRKALITGGDSGIGRAVAIAYAREGADVLISYLPEEDKDAAETLRWCRETGQAAVGVPGDIREERHCRRLVERAVADLGGLDVLVNNAAFQMSQDDGLPAVDDEQLMRTFSTNVFAMFWLCRAALPHLRAGACIINTASVQAYKPSPHLLDYATTKGAIVTFTKGLAKQVAERGIRVNAVAPGPVWTPLIPATMSTERVEQFGKQSPLDRPAQPAELAPAYVFLASQESSYITAEIMNVTGGTPLP